jgi:hypothetical protein
MSSNQGFRVASANWFLTYPKCSWDHQKVIAALQAKGKDVLGGSVGIESHQDGTPHVHVFLQLENKFNCKNPRFWDLEGFHGNYQAARVPIDVLRYVQKTGNYVDFGDFDLAAKLDARKKHSIYLGKRLQTESLLSVTEDHPELTMRYKQLKESVMAFRMDKVKPLTMESTRGVWIYGPAGVGKTHYVHHKEPDLYKKAQNKWWDGYDQNEAVLIDDLDKKGECLSHHLKIWTDKWACTGEVKGGHVPLNYKRFYVTSNYSIEQMFPKDSDSELYDAISRRFKVIHMVDRSMGLFKKVSARSRSAGSN